MSELRKEPVVPIGILDEEKSEIINYYKKQSEILKFGSNILKIKNCIDQRIQLERHRARDVPEYSYPTDGNLLNDDHEADEIAAYYFAEYEVDEDNLVELQRVVDKTRNTAMESLLIYFGTNEGWFGPDTFVSETSRFDKTDDNIGKLDMAIELGYRSGSPIVFTVDFTTAGDTDNMKKKVKEKAKQVSSSLLFLEEPLKIGGKRLDETQYTPFILCLSPENSNILIEQITGHEIGYEGQDEIKSTHVADDIMLLDRETQLKRAPYASLFMLQIIMQLKFYNNLLSEPEFIDDPGAMRRLDDVEKGLEYFQKQFRRMMRITDLDKFRELLEDSSHLALCRRLSNYKTNNYPQFNDPDYYPGMC